MVKIGGIQKFSTIDYPGYVVAGVFTIGCNMRCGYCHNPELVLPERYADAIPEEIFFEFLESRVGKLDGVAISGGEPTMQEDLVDFIRKIKSMGFMVKLDTNGTDPDVLEKLFAENLVDFVAMDIKGPLNVYSQIAARPIDEEAIIRSIELIKKSVPHEFRTTIVRGQLSVEDFEEIGRMVEGADRYALQYFIPGTVINSQFLNRESFSEKEMNQARNIMNKYVKECVVH